jgi:hypothetical protein
MQPLIAALPSARSASTLARLALAMLLIVAAPTWAETRLSVAQVVSFVKSAIQMKQQDRQVADILRKVTLTNKLDTGTVEDLQGLGAGPKTVEALMLLVDASKNLEAPPPPPKRIVVAIARPDAAEQAKVLGEVREYALSYVKQLPNFICLQVIRRYYDQSGMEFWHLADTITTRLTYFEQKENYKVVSINNRTTDVAYDKLSGATSSGEFGTLMREIFLPETETRFTWDHWATLRGRRVHVFTYRVLQGNSRWHVNYERTQDIVPGYTGSVYVDAEFPVVLRITMEAEDIPPTFPIQRAGTVLDFDYQKIGDNENLLPLRYVMNMRESKYLVKNEVEFRGYRKFSAETSIKFDDTPPPPLSDDKTKEQPVAAPPPPAGKKK